MPARPNRLLLALLIGAGSWSGGLRAAAADAPTTVIAVQVKGTVEVLHDQATTAEAVVEGTQLVTADTITTAAKSSVMLVLPNGSIVALKEKSRLKIAVALHSPAAAEALAANEAGSQETGTSQTGFELAFGQMLTRVRKLNPTSTFTVQTPVSVAAVRGTVFEVAYEPDTKGGAKYRLSTSSGLVHVTPHAGKMMAVPGDAQVDFTAELGKNGIKIKNLKSSKLARQKKQQIDKEAVANEHSAGEFMQRAQAAGAAAKAKAAAQATGNTPGAGTDRAGKPATPPAKPPAANNPTTSTNRTATPTPTVTRPATSVARPTPPPAKPKVLPKPVKRPPRRT